MAGSNKLLFELLLLYSFGSKVYREIFTCHVPCLMSNSFFQEGNRVAYNFLVCLTISGFDMHSYFFLSTLLGWVNYTK